MGILSNRSWPWGWGGDEPPPAAIRVARDAELAAAVRLIVPGGSFAEQAHAGELMRMAMAHRGDAGGMWVAEQGGQLVSAVLPIASPGRTLLFFLPADLRGVARQDVTRQVVMRVCEQAAAQGIHLAQALLDAGQDDARLLLERCGFARLAELLYMQSPIPRNLRLPAVPPGMALETYGPGTRDLFAQTILASYQRSLDCPALSGLRSIEDILAGHRATGEFDAKLWFAAHLGDQPLGVLLLSPVARSESIELVYLGVTPAARGRGIGDLLMRQAAAVVSGSRYSRLSLAVDAANLPAMKLYWRHGLQAIGRKIAYLRDLRAAATARP